mgnify:CR=1 FL=1
MKLCGCGKPALDEPYETWWGVVVAICASCKADESKARIATQQAEDELRAVRQGIDKQYGKRK